MPATSSNIPATGQSAVPDFPYPIFWRRANGTAEPQWQVAPQDMQGDTELTEVATVFPDELRDDRLFRRQGAPDHPDVLGDFDTLKEIATDFGQTTPQTGFEFTARNLLIRAYQYLIAKFDSTASESTR